MHGAAAMRPRERYLVEGPEGLGDVELLALVLRTGAGGRGVREIAAGLLDRHGTLSELAAVQPRALAGTRGIGPARAVSLHAALALAGRTAAEVRRRPDPVATPAAAAAWFLPTLAKLDHEEVHALLLDRQLRPTGYRKLSAGSDRASVLDPRSVLRTALQAGAAAVILAHNHPSGVASPSPQDLQVTRRLREAGRILDLPVLDHLVIADGRWTSMAEDEGWSGGSWRDALVACGGA